MANLHALIFDASVIRNFALLDALDMLSEITSSRLRIVRDVLGPGGEGSDLERIRDGFERKYLTANVGSPRYSLYQTGCINLDRLREGGFKLELIAPSDDAAAEAVRLHDPSAELRAELGLGVRRLSLADGATVAVALELQEELATDDEAIAQVYASRSGIRQYWTRDLMKRAVEQQHLTEAGAQHGYEVLIASGFWGIPWDEP